VLSNYKNKAKMLTSSEFQGLSLAAAVSSSEAETTPSSLLAQSCSRLKEILNPEQSEDWEDQLVETLECLFLSEPELLKLISNQFQSEFQILVSAR
jgi:hypothetical protein